VPAYLSYKISFLEDHSRLAGFLFPTAAASACQKPALKFSLFS